ncbi:hypothetical protein SUGI_0597760 [Cryptomeria japonica]|nr:hypothetical protein SUGI_0597760 [Cryptomeria japonica]
MGPSCNCCWCWKRKPTERAPPNPSVSPCTSPSQDLVTTSINPSTDSPNQIVISSTQTSSTTPHPPSSSKKPTESAPPNPPVNPCTSSSQDLVTTSINPSTHSPNQLQMVISSTQPSSTAPHPPPSSKKPPRTLEEVISNFQEIDIKSQGDGFIKAIEDNLKTAQKRTTDTPSTSSSHTDKPSNWASIIQSGGTFLKFVNDHTEKIKIDTKDSSFQLGEATKIVGNILEQIGQLHWAVAGLSMVGYLVSKCAKVSQNRIECVELLQQMIKLVSHITKLNIFIKEEKVKFEEAFQYIIEGSLCCASQQQSGKFFSFLKSSVNSEKLSGIRTKISELYMDLNLTATTKVLDETLQQKTVTKQILRQKTVRKEILPQVFPEGTVGIEGQVKAVNELLDMENMEDCSSFAVVIWGLGGIGKTTLAKAVVSTVDRNRYNYARIELDLDSGKNNYKEMQQQILKDAFPSYEEGRKIDLRNDEDGREHLTQAYKSGAEKPVFLYIDNALHIKDLEKILPENLRGLPQNSRILVTTRILIVTDVLQERGLQRKDYPVKTLSHHHALTILCNDPAIRHDYKDDLERIVKLCSGIPLVLKIVGAHLRKQEYKADRCTQILEALHTGQKIKEKDLSNCLFDFVYSKLEESTQEAFLDICCFFHQNWLRQVEYIVGAEEVAFLVDAALITTVMKWGEEYLSVHDIIRSIGCTMSKSSRITDDDSWFEAEKDEAKMKGIKGIWLNNEDCMLEKRHLRSMKDTLRILRWKGSIDVHATDAVALPELRFLYTTSNNICGLNVETLEKLRFLGVFNLSIKEGDHLKARAEIEAQHLSKIVPNSSLEELILYFKGGETEEFMPSSGGESCDEEIDSSNKEQESFNEKHNKTINAFNKFLQGLNRLKHLWLMNCGFLCEFPEQVCRLPQLATLRIEGCDELEYLPESFGQLTTLRRLELRGCRSLKELPFTFSNLKSLEYLRLLNCDNLESDICQRDDNIKIVKKSEHNCDNCHEDKKIEVIIF